MVGGAQISGLNDPATRKLDDHMTDLRARRDRLREDIESLDAKRAELEKIERVIAAYEAPPTRAYRRRGAEVDDANAAPEGP
jgi:hypothetical protein